MSKFKQSSKHLNLSFHQIQASDRITAIYKALYQFIDVVLGLVFLIGSILFFNSSTVTNGTILFVIGSIQMTIRPLIAFVHDLHLAFKRKQ